MRACTLLAHRCAAQARALHIHARAHLAPCAPAQGLNPFWALAAARRRSSLVSAGSNEDTALVAEAEGLARSGRSTRPSREGPPAPGGPLPALPSAPVAGRNRRASLDLSSMPGLVAAQQQLLAQHVAATSASHATLSHEGSQGALSSRGSGGGAARARRCSMDLSAFATSAILHRQINEAEGGGGLRRMSTAARRGSRDAGAVGMVASAAMQAQAQHHHVRSSRSSHSHRAHHAGAVPRCGSEGELRHEASGCSESTAAGAAESSGLEKQASSSTVHGHRRAGGGGERGGEGEEGSSRGGASSRRRSGTGSRRPSSPGGRRRSSTGGRRPSASGSRRPSSTSGGLGGLGLLSRRSMTGQDFRRRSLASHVASPSRAGQAAAAGPHSRPRRASTLVLEGGSSSASASAADLLRLQADVGVVGASASSGGGPLAGSAFQPITSMLQFAQRHLQSMQSMRGGAGGGGHQRLSQGGGGAGFAGPGGTPKSPKHGSLSPSASMPRHRKSQNWMRNASQDGGASDTLSSLGGGARALRSSSLKRRSDAGGLSLDAAGSSKASARNTTDP